MLSALTLGAVHCGTDAEQVGAFALLLAAAGLAQGTAPTWGSYCASTRLAYDPGELLARSSLFFAPAVLALALARSRSSHAHAQRARTLL